MEPEPFNDQLNQVQLAYVPSFPEHIIDSASSLLAELKSPHISQDKLNNTPTLIAEYDSDDAPLLLACGNNLNAKFKDYSVRITFLNLCEVAVYCGKCVSSSNSIPYGCHCAIHVLHLILQAPQTIHQLDPATISFLGSCTTSISASDGIGLVSLRLSLASNKYSKISRMVKLSGVIYSYAANMTCRIFKKTNGNWATECCCKEFSIRTFCVHVASLPSNILAAALSVHDGDHLHHVFSSIPQSVLVSNILRYCLTYSCDDLILQELSDREMDTTEDNTVCEKLFASTSIDEGYCKMHSMPLIFAQSATHTVGAISFLAPYIAAIVDSVVVVMRLSKELNSIEESFCVCKKVDILWCSHVIAVMCKMMKGNAIDFTALQDRLLSVPHNQLVQMFLNVYFCTTANLHAKGIFRFAESKDIMQEWIEVSALMKATYLLDGPILQGKYSRKPAFMGQWRSDIITSSFDDYLGKIHELIEAGLTDVAFGVLYKLTESMPEKAHKLDSEWLTLFKRSPLTMPKCLEWIAKLNELTIVFAGPQTYLMHCYASMMDETNFLAAVVNMLLVEGPTLNPIQLLGWVQSARERNKLLEALLLCLKILTLLVYDGKLADETILEVHGLVHTAISEILIMAHTTLKDESLITGVESLTKLAAKSATSYVFKYYEIQPVLETDLYGLYTTFQPLVDCLPIVILELIAVAAPVFLKNGAEIFQLAELFMNLSRPRFALALGIQSLSYPDFISTESMLDLCNLILISNDTANNRMLVETCAQCDFKTVVLFAEKIAEKRPRVAMQLAAIAAKKSHTSSDDSIKLSLLSNLLPIFAAEENAHLLKSLLSSISNPTVLLESVLQLDLMGFTRSAVVALEQLSTCKHASAHRMFAQQFGVILSKDSISFEDLAFASASLKKIILETKSDDLLTILGSELAKIGHNELAIMAITKMGLQLCLSRTT